MPLTFSRSIATYYLLVLICLSAAPKCSQGQSITGLRIVLAGDSTVTDDSGWGQGFAELLNDNIACINLAKGGRSSRSFRSEGWWDKCLEAKPDYLFIQFGHNDQPGKGVERESDAETDFREHLRRYIQEARQAEIKPILVTSLTRRRWTAEDTIEPSLSQYAEATRIVAKEQNIPLIDLHSLSIQQCEMMGPTAYRALEPMTEKGADHTHLNAEGSRAVAALVASATIEAIPELANIFNAEKLAEYAIVPQQRSRQASGNLQLDETESTIDIRFDGKPVLSYNKASPPLPAGIEPIYRRSGFLHPVASPSGQVVTEVFPADHAHQNGIFTAWVTTKWSDRPIDFWNLAAGTGRVSHQRVISTFAEPRKVGFVVDLVHTAQKKPIVDILRERWKVTAWETDGRYHMFDLETTQTALTELPLVVEKYHYGGVGYRGPTAWLTGKETQSNDSQHHEKNPDLFRFVTDNGADRVAGNGQSTRWVSATGKLDGKAVSIVIMGHKNNFRSPQAVRLHPTKPYFAFSPCIDNSFTIDRQNAYHALYRYLIIDDIPDQNWIEDQWKKWHEM